jgi:hypothetical protein
MSSGRRAGSAIGCDETIGDATTEVVGTLGAVVCSVVTVVVVVVVETGSTGGETKFCGGGVEATVVASFGGAGRLNSGGLALTGVASVLATGAAGAVAGVVAIGAPPAAFAGSLREHPAVITAIKTTLSNIHENRAIVLARRGALHDFFTDQGI